MRGTSLPYVEDDETIYSFCATAHAWSGSDRAEHTARALTGAATSARHHDLPLALRNFPLDQTRHPVDAFHWATTHTIAGYYVPFMSRAAQELASAAWFTGGPKARSLINGKIDGVRLEHPLKWCEDCAEGDIERLGRPYWHVAHQFPTTWQCAFHRRPLRCIQARRKRWLLPRDVEAGATAQTIKGADFPIAGLLSALGEVIRSVAQVDRMQIVAMSAEKLRALGLASETNSEPLEEWFRSSRVSRFLLTCPPGLMMLADGHWIARHVSPRTLAHPIHCTLLWCAFDWDSPETAAATFRQASSGCARFDSHRSATLKGARQHSFEAN